MKQRITIFELSSEQILEVEFDNCNIVRNMIQTCYAFPDDYPIIEMPFNSKIIKMWFVGCKATGNRVFMMKNGVCVTEEKKRIKDLSSIIWRLRLERD